MGEHEYDPRPASAQPGPGWAEAAFDALDMAAVLLGENLRLRAVNAAWRQRVSNDIEEGADVAQIMSALTEAPPGKRVGGFTGRDLVGLVKSCVRDYELPRPGVDPLLLTSTPTQDGGYLVTLRDPDRGRIVEARALELLRDSIEAVDMGMMVWDSGLIVRMVNESWTRHAAAAEPGETVHQVGRRIMQQGKYKPRHDLSADETLTAVIMEAHRHKRRWEIHHDDGRQVRISTFPMQSGGVLAVAFDVTERKDIEAQARSFVSDAVDSLGDGVLLLDGHLISLMHNRAFAERFYGPAQLPAMGVSVTELVRNSIEQGQTLLPDGVSQPVFLDRMKNAILDCAKNIPIKHPGGQVADYTSYPTAMGGYVVVFRDVTERVEAEAALRETEALTRTIVESLGEGIALYDDELRLEMNNSAFRDLVFDGKELSRPGMHIADELRAAIASGNYDVPDGKVEPTVDWIIDCVKKHCVDIEYPMRNGRTLEASNFGTPEGGYLILMRDVTARKAAERAQREADELVRTIIDASPTTFLVSRLDDGKVIYAPPLSRERFGEIKTTLSFFLDPSDRQLYIKELTKTGSLTDYPVRFRRKNGTIMDGLTSARVIHFKGEELIVSATRDITDQLAMQSELERQSDLAHQNEKLSALGGLLAGVAHELNNPLSIVVANALMLEEDVDDPALRRRVERLATAAKRSGRIVKTFLSMARNRPMRTEQVEVNEILDAAIEISAYGLQAKGAQITVTRDTAAPKVEADADQIIQVLSNLIINAEHALRDKGSDGRLELSTRTDADAITIVVRDNGPGVPEEMRSRIFEPYFTTKEVGEGTGVGLAFCHRVVTAHGGKICAYKAETGGAEFRVELPRIQSDASHEANPQGDAPARTHHVLVLDDEPDVAVTVSDALQRGGYKATVACSADEALALCAKSGFDAILSDLRMPVTDGLGFFEELNRRNPDQAGKVAFMTGDAMGQARGGGVAQTGRPYLEKPAEPTEILALVAQLIEGTADAT